MHYFQFEIKEWISNTAHLSLEEEAIYLRLINYYYDSEKPIPYDADFICRKLRIQNQDIYFQILKEFFVEIDDGYSHERCDQEIARYKAKIEQATKAGLASVKARLSARSTTVQPIINHKPLTINQDIKPKASADAIVCPDDVDKAIWTDYLKVRKAKKSPITETALNGLRREAKKADINLNDALKVCCERGWIGFKADWYKPATQKQELPLGSPEQIEYAYRVECGGDPTKARFTNYHEMRKYITDQREKRAKVNA
jgi:uncharacterized protein YdaU (DUF1376 family)